MPAAQKGRQNRGKNIMKNVVSAFAALAFIGSISGALAQADAIPPNGGNQDTSKTVGMPKAHMHRHHHKRHNSAMHMPSNGGGQTDNMKGVPDEAKQQ
jgi:hypothetical protein